ncbi:MAG: GDP-mannose 4,6-dehydratase, partial [Aggregatilineales bacterium]
LERGYKEAIDRIEKLSGKKIIFIQGDLRKTDDIENALQETKPDSVIHFAAYKSVGEGQKEPEKYFENNVHATEILVQSMIQNNIKRIIFSSSAAVYGINKDLPITENSPTNPISVYGKTKLSKGFGLRVRLLNIGLNARIIAPAVHDRQIPHDLLSACHTVRGAHNLSFLA